MNDILNVTITCAKFHGNVHIFVDVKLFICILIAFSNVLLPPANEVLGKVMFFTSVCHSVQRGEGWLPSMHHR